MSTFDAHGVTGVVWRRIDPRHEAEAEAVMARIMQLARASTGFIGSEIFPPVPGIQGGYVVLYRFERSEYLRLWLQSPERKRLIDQISHLLIEPSFEFFLAHGRRPAGTASSVFSYRIRPECRKAFDDWRHRIQEAMRRFDGFLGAESFDALNGDHPEFIVVIRFQSRAALDAWIRSDIRARFMEELRNYVDDFRVRRIGSGFEGWFDVSDDRTPPPRWRQALSILAVLFPLIMFLRQVFAKLFEDLPFPAALLILLALDVALLTYVIMPHFSRWMNFWLRPKPGLSWRAELAGWIILLGMIGTTLAVCLALHL